MPNKWLDALKGEESKHNAVAALRASTKPGVVGPEETPKTPECHTDKTSKITSGCKAEGENLEIPEKLPSKTSKIADAERLGLVATWSMEFGYISLHDPTTGEWHDVPTKEAPGWARWEAAKRKELHKAGNRKAYRLTSHDMSEIWQAQRASEPEGIVEDHPVEEED